MHAKYLDFILDLTIKKHITAPDATKQNINKNITYALLICAKNKIKKNYCTDFISTNNL